MNTETRPATAVDVARTQMTCARDLTLGDVFVEAGHQFTVTAIEPTPTGKARVRSTLPGGAPHTHFLAPDTEMDTR